MSLVSIVGIISPIYLTKFVDVFWISDVDKSELVNCSWVECVWASLIFEEDNSLVLIVSFGISVLWYDSLDSILDVDAVSGLNLFVVDSPVFSGDEIVDDGIVDDSFVSTISKVTTSIIYSYSFIV